MTVKNDLHELVDELDEHDAREALAYLRALRELPSQPSSRFVEDTQRAVAEAFGLATDLSPSHGGRLSHPQWDRS